MDARSTAARVSLLLPSQAQLISKRASPPVGKPAVSTWIPLAAFLAILGFGIAFQMITPRASTRTATPSFAQTIAHPQAGTN